LKQYTHYARQSFWDGYNGLPKEIQDIADKQYQLLEQNPNHPSLQLKKVSLFYSVRVNDNYRALALKVDNDFIWFWIGNHRQYEQLLSRHR